MKKLFIAILAALTLSATSAVAQDVPFPDIPENHWALDAVAEIADLGIVIGFPDGTFRGNESFTRYQAALVVSRLLDVVNENIAAAQAMTQEDIAALRNALQELASDVAAQGVRLAAAESAIAAISDDVVANTARIAALEEALEAAAGQEGIDPEVLRDLQNQIASQRVAIDTAQAQAEAAEARANEAFDLANQALALARENADQIAAINSLLQLLADELDALPEQPQAAPGPIAGLDDIRSQIQRLTNDVANIREFVILLRRDQVALRDRVAALEASDAEQTAAIEDLQARVTAIEENPLGLTGAIEIDYRVVRVSPTAGFVPFDIDRAYGQGLDRERFSVFTTGEATEDEGDLEEKADFTGGEEGDVEISPEVTFAWAALEGTGPLGTENFSAVISFNLDAGLDAIDADGYDLWIEIDEIAVLFDPIGADPFTFLFGEDIDVQFTEYVVDTEDLGFEDGFVLTVGAPDFLDFLEPTLTVLYTTSDVVGDFSYLRGLRATVSPFTGVVAGFTAAQLVENAEEAGDIFDDNVETTVLGADLQASLGLLALEAEYATSTEDGVDQGAIFYTIVELDPTEIGVPILDEIVVNYRDIDGNWFSDVDGLNPGVDNAVFEQDQAGFAVFANLDLFILDVSGYYDQFITGAGAGETSLGYGVAAIADLPLGFVLEAFYNQASFAGVVVDSLADPVSGDEVVVGNGANTVRDDNEYETEFGVVLVHDGLAEGAIIPGLTLEFAYTQAEADFSRTIIEAEADFLLEVSILAVTPYVGYRTSMDSDVGAIDSTRIKAGAGLVTEPLSIIFRPALRANVNYRTTTYTGGADYTADLLQFSAGLVLEEFLFENSELSVDYASYSGTNVAAGTNLSGVGDVAPGVGGDTSVSVSVSGYEVVWDYAGLAMAYGVYVADDDTATADEQVAQAFTISYVVTF